MYQIHVYIRDRASGLSWWRAMRPSGSEKPYVYATEDEARQIARMCYPLADRSQVRVVEA